MAMKLEASNCKQEQEEWCGNAIGVKVYGVFITKFLVILVSNLKVKANKFDTVKPKYNNKQTNHMCVSICQT